MWFRVSVKPAIFRHIPDEWRETCLDATRKKRHRGLRCLERFVTFSSLNLPSRPVFQKVPPGYFYRTLRSRRSRRLRPAAASNLRTRKTRNAYQAPARPLLPIRSGSCPILRNPSILEGLIKTSSSLRWRWMAGSGPPSGTCWNGRFLSSILPAGRASCHLPVSWKSFFAPIHWIWSHLKNSASPAQHEKALPRLFVPDVS